MMADKRSAKPQEIFMENLNLKEDNQKLKRDKERRERHPSINDDEENSDTARCKFRRKDAKTVVKYFLVCLVVAVVLSVYIMMENRHRSDLQALVLATSSQAAEATKHSAGAGIPPFTAQQIGDGVKDSIQKYYVNIGMRQDYLLQECQGSQFKQSFPDLDYALLGYNILKGFPLAVGHDPGFTYPIFTADYSSGAHTADCRYSVPKGLVVVPDVSCVTSFSSTTVQTKYEFAKSLSVSASVSGGGWGVSFSASAGYKESSAEMSTGESVFILSTASCNYYFSKLVTEGPPRLDDVFEKWVYKLNKTKSNPELYFNFFDTYGTHFPTEVTFGARYTYEHKMSSQKYETQREKGVNVAVEASYSGLFSVGGGFSLDSSQREAASDFSKSVETKTITVGAAPPANGDAMTWASEVKTSPVPTAYKLSSIESLFTDRYMGHLNVDLKQIRENIIKEKYQYCLFLKNKGKLESCEDLVAGIQLKNTRLADHYRRKMVSTISECIETCLEELKCEATTFCVECPKSDINYKTCYFYKEDSHDTSAEETGDVSWQSNIFPGKMKTQIEFSNTAVVGNARGFEEERDKRANAVQCRQLCVEDAHCVAYSHCNCPTKTSQCNMYSKEQIQGLKEESGTNTFFISSRYYDSKTTASTPRSG